MEQPAHEVRDIITVTEVEIVQVFKAPVTLTTELNPDTSATKTISSTPVETASFEETMLNMHNHYRSLHGSQQVVWNTSLFEFASQYSSKYDCSGILKHSGGPFGENLAIGYTAEGAVTAWYDEGSSYDYSSQQTYNHFTQVIWNSTSSIGCAKKYCNTVWGDYIICSYYPPGNVIGNSLENVFPMR